MLFSHNELTQHYKVANIYRAFLYFFCVFVCFISAGWALGYSFSQYGTMILAPNACLSFVLYWVSDLNHPSPSTVDISLFLIIVLSSIFAFIGTVRDGAPLSSCIIGGFGLLCYYPGYLIVSKSRRNLVSLPGRDIHVMRVIFLGGVAALIPVTYLMFDSVSCVLLVDKFYSLDRSSRTSRTDDDIYRLCSAIFVPNYCIGLHLVIMHSVAVFYAPFAQFSISEMMRFKLPMRPRIQSSCVLMATLVSLYIFSSKEDDEGSVAVEEMQLTSAIFFLWSVVIVVQSTSNEFWKRLVNPCAKIRSGESRKKEIGESSRGIELPETCLDDLRASTPSTSISSVSASNTSTSSLASSKKSSTTATTPTHRLMKLANFVRFSTKSNVEIAPVYKYLFVTVQMVQVCCAIFFSANNMPRAMWLFYLNVPNAFLSTSILFMASPRQKKTKIGSALYLTLPISFLLLGLGHLKTGYKEEKTLQAFVISVTILLAQPVLDRLRNVLANLSDEDLSHHMQRYVFGSFGAFVSMFFFLSEGFGCVMKSENIKEIDSVCGGIVYPGFGCAMSVAGAHISVVCFDQKYKQGMNRYTEGEFIKLKIPTHNRVQLVLQLLINVLCLFLFGSIAESPITQSLETLVLLIVFLWVFSFILEAANILRSLISERHKEELKKMQLNRNNLFHQASFIKKVLTQEIKDDDIEEIARKNRKVVGEKGSKNGASNFTDLIYGTSFENHNLAAEKTFKVENPMQEARGKKSKSGRKEEKPGEEGAKKDEGGEKRGEKREGGEEGERESRTLTFSISPLVRHLAFYPCILVLIAWILGAVLHDEEALFWNWMAYNWNVFAMTNIMLIWASRVRRPLRLELLAYMYFPLMFICNEINFVNGHDYYEFFDSLWTPAGLVLCFVGLFILKKIRNNLAELDDVVLSNHVQRVVYRVGISIIVPVCYFGMRGTACLINERQIRAGELEGGDDDGFSVDTYCSAMVTPLVCISFHMAAFLCFQLAFLPFLEFSMVDLMIFKMPLINKIQVILIIVCSWVSLYIFGALHEGHIQGSMYELRSLVWLIWLIVGSMQFFTVLRKELAGRQRAKGVHRTSQALCKFESSPVIKSHLKTLESSEPKRGIDDIDGAKILSGEGGMMSPGLV